MFSQSEYRRRILSLLLSLLLWGMTAVVSPSMAQSTSLPDSTGEPSIGIALSGGGAKGFAHIGVLKELDRLGFPIKIVAGTSMGAVIGGLYAMGYSPERIEEIALDTDWRELFNDNNRTQTENLSTFISNRENYQLSFPLRKTRVQLPAGLVDGQNIAMLLYRLSLPYHDLSDFSRLPVPFAAIATDLGDGSTKRFEQGYLPEVIRASAAIPSIFKPVEIDGRKYIDGGITRSIPVEDVRAMGADFVLASDVGEPIKHVDSLNTFVDVLFQSIGFLQVTSDSIQISKSDLYIRPAIETYNSFSYEHTADLIRLGEEAVRAVTPRLRKVADSLGISLAPPNRTVPGLNGDSLLVTDLRLQNIDSRMVRQIELALNIPLPSRMTYREIEKKIQRLYGTGLFSLISYRIQTDPQRERGNLLTLSFKNNTPDRLGFSMRYDSRYQASLLFGAQLRNQLTWGDSFQAELRLGEVLGLHSVYTYPLSLTPATRLYLQTNILRSPIDLFLRDDRFATITVEQIELYPGISISALDRWTLRTGLHIEYFSLKESVGTILIDDKNSLLVNGISSLEFNNIDRSYFPKRGQMFRFYGEASTKELFSDATFYQLGASGSLILPLLKDISWNNRVSGGHSSTTRLPIHYRYYIGGLTTNSLFPLRQFPMYGYRTQQLSGANHLFLSSGLQWEVRPNIYLAAGWNAAHLADTWTWNPDRLDLRHGYQLQLGARTLIGPVKLSLSTPDFRNNFVMKLDIGYTF